MRTRTLTCLAAVCCWVGTAVGGATIIDHTSVAGVNSISQDRMEQIATTVNFFFAHGDIGNNVLSGLAGLNASDPARYSLTYLTRDDGAPPASTLKGVVYEYNRGDPAWHDKLDIFKDCLDSGWASRADLVLSDFDCADLTLSLLPYAVLNANHDALSQLEAGYPNARIVYMTVPLTTAGNADNITRNNFNESLRAWVKNHNKILLDIADIQAWSGLTQATFSSGGKTYQMLANGYSSDGTHLNALGSRQVALGFYALAATYLPPGPLFQLRPGDTNMDGRIDGVDLATFSQNWDPLGINGSRTWQQGDFNGDGVIDGVDLAILAQNWNPLGYDVTDYISVVRPSVATRLADGVLTDVAANVPRIEPTAAVGRVTLSDDCGQYIPLCVDPGRDLLLCTSPIDGCLYTTRDGVVFNKVYDIGTQEPIMTFVSTSGGSFKSACVIGNAWIVWFGNSIRSGGEGSAQCIVVRSTDGGANWKTIHSNNRGASADFYASTQYSVYGNALVYGDYQGPGYPDSGAVYYTANALADSPVWQEIYTPPDKPLDITRHVHTCLFKPGDPTRVYAVYGDGAPYEGVLLLHNNAGTWELEKTLTSQGYDMAVVGQDGRLYFCGGVCRTYDPASNTWGDFFSRPVPSQYHDPANAPYSPYTYLHHGINDYTMFLSQIGGVWYAPIMHYDDPETYWGDGLYVSLDGKDWVAAYRTTDTKGIIGVIGQAGGKLWMDTQYLSGQHSLRWIAPVPAATVQALRLEKGARNALRNVQISTVSATDIQWFTEDTDPGSHLSVVAGGIHGDYCLKAQMLRSGEPNIRSPMLSELGPDNLPDLTNKYITFSFYYKAAPGTPDWYQITALLYQRPGQMEALSASESTITNGWRKVTICGYCTGNGWNDSVHIRFDDGGLGGYANAVFYLDGFQLLYDDERWFTSSSFIQGGVTNSQGKEGRQNEYAVLPLTGLGQAWTVAFDWRPDSASIEHPGETPLAAIAGSGNTWLYLKWDGAAGKFVLSDSAGHSTATAEVYSGTASPETDWRHFDMLRFVIASDGVNSTLWVCDAVQGSKMTAANGVALPNMAIPMSLQLGTNGTLSKFGCGRYLGLTLYPTNLTAATVNATLTRPVTGFR